MQRDILAALNDQQGYAPVPDASADENAEETTKPREPVAMPGSWRSFYVSFYLPYGCSAFGADRRRVDGAVHDGRVVACLFGYPDPRPGERARVDRLHTSCTTDSMHALARRASLNL